MCPRTPGASVNHFCYCYSPVLAVMRPLESQLQPTQEARWRVPLHTNLGVIDRGTLDALASWQVSCENPVSFWEFSQGKSSFLHRRYSWLSFWAASQSKCRPQVSCWVTLSRHGQWGRSLAVSQGLGPGNPGHMCGNPSSEPRPECVSLFFFNSFIEVSLTYDKLDSTY